MLSPEERTDLILARLKKLFLISYSLLIIGSLALGVGHARWQHHIEQQRDQETTLVWMERRLEQNKLELLEVVLTAAKTGRHIRPLGMREMNLLNDIGGEPQFVRPENAKRRKQCILLLEMVVNRKKRRQGL